MSTGHSLESTAWHEQCFMNIVNAGTVDMFVDVCTDECNQQDNLITKAKHSVILMQMDYFHWNILVTLYTNDQMENTCNANVIGPDSKILKFSKYYEIQTSTKNRTQRRVTRTTKIKQVCQSNLFLLLHAKYVLCSFTRCANYRHKIDQFADKCSKFQKNYTQNLKIGLFKVIFIIIITAYSKLVTYRKCFTSDLRMRLT